MKIRWVRHIDGPNVYLYKPILVGRIHLEEYTERETCEFQGFTERLLDILPGLHEHHCAKGAPGGFIDRLYGGTYFGHVVEHVSIELATTIGLNVHYGKTVYADGPGIYDIVLECACPKTQTYLLTESARLVSAILDGRAVSIETVQNEAARIFESMQLGPSTKAIYDACRRRDIPVRRVSDGSILELGYGRYLRRIEATLTDHSSAVAVDIASDKQLTKKLLQDGGIPVPDGFVASEWGEVEKSLSLIGYPLVIKPKDGRQGRGVTLAIKTEEEARRAFFRAKEYGPDVMVESHLEGENLRLTVVGGVCAAVAMRVPASVVGDGHHTLVELVDILNRDPRRGKGHARPLTFVQLDDVALETIRRQGCHERQVIPRGKRVWLRDSANLSTGGQAIDITDECHESYKRMAERAVRRLHLDVCGVDLVVSDWRQPASQSNCAVLECNAAPGIRMHQSPSGGEGRDVGSLIVDTLFPPHSNGRIPIISVTGTNGKTTTTRLIGHAFESIGTTVGMTTTGGVFIGKDEIVKGDTTGPQSARMVLTDPAVEVAVLETARGGICRGGLAYDKADVAVVTNISVDHIGQDGVDTLEDLIHIKSLVVECLHPHGTVVLNADDEYARGMKSRVKCRIVYVSSRPDNPYVLEHVGKGGIGYYVSQGMLVEACGQISVPILRVGDIPLTMGGFAAFHVENAICAFAALRAAGMSRETAASALLTFQPTTQNDGRCDIYELPDHRFVVLDYGHNPAGFKRVGQWLKSLPHRQLVGVVGVPGDRADAVIKESGDGLADIFDAFVIKEDADKRGRSSGEVAALLSMQIRNRCPSKPCVTVLDETEAVKTVINVLQPGDIGCVFYEKSTHLRQVLLGAGAKQVSAEQIFSTFREGEQGFVSL